MGIASRTKWEKRAKRMERMHREEDRKKYCKDNLCIPYYGLGFTGNDKLTRELRKYWLA